MLLVSSGWRGEPEIVGDDGVGGAQHRGDQRRQIEMALAGGAHDAGEHLLGVGAVAGAVATADLTVKGGPKLDQSGGGKLDHPAARWRV